jgi:lysophospholipase L1-like esterase
MNKAINYLITLCLSFTCASIALCQQKKAITYLALGDSYTIGESINAKGRYPAQVADILGEKGIHIKEVRYIATTGWTTEDLQQAIDAAHPADYDFITLLIGVNDQYQGIDTGTYATHFTQLLQNAIRLARGNKQNVFIISIPDYGVTPFGGNNKNISRQIDLFNMVNKRITDAYHIAYVDVTALSRQAASDKSLITGDGLHYTAKEYRLWAGKLAEVMCKKTE